MIKRILILLISLAILLAIVNFAKAATLDSKPVCQINGSIVSLEQVGENFTAQINIASSFILSGVEYGDCNYLGNNITVNYSSEQYQRLALMAGDYIMGKIEFADSELKLSEVVISSAGPKNEELIIANSVAMDLKAKDVWAGQKFSVFDNQFIFQIDSKMINQDATLNLREIILPPNSYMAPDKGLQLASRVYEYDFKTTGNQDFGKAFWFSIKYGSADYFRKNIYYFDEVNRKWTGLAAIIKNGSSKIVANFDQLKVKLAILENIDIMTEGTASWYKYKGCNCAASPDYPKGTKLKVTNLDNNKSVVVKVNDWGPDRSVHPDRVIDLDVVAFKQIAKKSAGLCKVKVELADDAVATALANK
jgi:rare lipoprotein A